MIIEFKDEIKLEKQLTNQEIIKRILSLRKINNLDDFLYPKSPNLISIFDFDEKYQNIFSKAATILKQAKNKKQMVIVYTDYDADGITGGAILWETLHLLGFKTMPYVPDRKTEGYGFSIKGIDKVIKKFNPAVIISVDHGITKIKEVSYTKNKGIKIIITDHHLKGEKTPRADAIFHIPALSGAGVAYFFAKQLYKYFKSPTFYSKLLASYFQADYLLLASIGTVADLVPLIGPARSLVKYGLSAFCDIKRLGIKHILKEAGIEGKKITPYDIGFIIAPRINAVGRLENAIDALRLLCTKKEDKAHHLASYVGKMNRIRQNILEESLKEAKKILSQESKNFTSLKKIIILTSNRWHEGIIGLIASKMVEEFYRPSIILTKLDGFYKASARSISGFHITKFLTHFKKYLVDVGGHEQAAGFTLKEKELKNFKREVEKKADILLKKEDLEKKLIADLKIPISFINLPLVKTIEKLAPFGIGNPQPIFYSEGQLIDAKIFGKKNEHLKILVKCPNKKIRQSIEFLELIGFYQSQLFYQLSPGQKINIAYNLEINKWREEEKIRGKILALKW